jgi:hypothetical protein
VFRMTQVHPGELKRVLGLYFDALAFVSVNARSAFSAATSASVLASAMPSRRCRSVLSTLRGPVAQISDLSLLSLPFSSFYFSDSPAGGHSPAATSRRIISSKFGRHLSQVSALCSLCKIGERGQVFPKFLDHLDVEYAISSGIAHGSQGLLGDVFRKTEDDSGFHQQSAWSRSSNLAIRIACHLILALIGVAIQAPGRSLVPVATTASLQQAIRLSSELAATITLQRLREADADSARYAVRLPRRIGRADRRSANPTRRAARRRGRHHDARVRHELERTAGKFESRVTSRRIFARIEGSMKEQRRSVVTEETMPHAERRVRSLSIRILPALIDSESPLGARLLRLRVWAQEGVERCNHGRDRVVLPLDLGGNRTILDRAEGQ